MTTISVSLLFVAAPEIGSQVHSQVVTIPTGTALDAFLSSVAVRAFLSAAGTHATLAGTGVWGRVRPADYVLREADRVEFYRELTADPKDARRAKAGPSKRRKH
jgi:uncharacterized protein